MPARTPAEVHLLFVKAFSERAVDALLSLYESESVTILTVAPE